MDKAPDAFRTISEVADELDIPQHVLRFWETRFTQIKPMKRSGGRRYYRPDDVDLLKGIRRLLYGEGYTIRGVQRILKEITDCLEKGETVKLSSFGSFMVRKKGQRIGRNPKTGTEVPISPRRVMVFKPSAILKQRINGHAVANGDGKAE